MNLESVGLTVAAAVVSLLLAVLLLGLGRREVLLAIALLAGVGHLVAAGLAAAGLLGARSRVAAA